MYVQGNVMKEIQIETAEEYNDKLMSWSIKYKNCYQTAIQPEELRRSLNKIPVIKQ